MTDEEQLTDTEREELKQLLGYGASTPEAKHNVHSFLTNVVTAEDTLKLSNLDMAELGKAEHPVRAYKFLSLFAKEIMNKPKLANFFNNRSEILTASALSKEGFLLRLAVTQKRELADVTKKRKPNTGWFKKKGGDSEDKGSEV